MLHELNHVIDYIEAHLTNELTLRSISDYAGVSDYHFRKIFFYISGITLNDYIKQRKLSEANKDLLNGEKVTDVAFKYGYDSIDGFSRAFKKWSGFLPSEVIKKGLCKSFPKFTFAITIKGGENMEFRIEKKPAFNFVGVTARVPMQFEGVNQEIVKLTQQITEEQADEMHRLQNLEPYEFVNVSYDADSNFMKEEGDLTHLVGILTTEEQISNSLDKMPVAPYTWAVFPNEGLFPNMLQETMIKIYSEWLPSSNYEIVPAPSFSFTKMNEEKKDHAYSEIWVPVRKR